MSNLRQQFAATSTKKLKEVVEEEDSKISSGGFSDYLKYDKGLNKFRLFPKHPGESTYSVLRCTHWITIEDDKGEPKKLTVPNARNHANVEKDIIEEYISFVKRTLSSTDAEDAAKIKSLTKYPGGLQMQSSWIAYANKVEKKGNEFGLLEFRRTVRDGLNDASIIEDESEAIETDPFTDPDDGLPVIITYNPDAKKAADYYKVQISKNKMPLTDEELEKFSKLTPLSQLPQVTYTQKDFEQAVEGMRYFDAENDINLFDTEEFQAIIEEVGQELAAASGNDTKVESKDSSIKGGTKKSTTKEKETVKSALKKGLTKKPVVEEEEIVEEVAEEEPEIEEEIAEEEPEIEEEGDQFTLMDRLELRKFIAKNPELKDSVKVFVSDSEDDIREKIRNAVNLLAMDVPFEVEKKKVVTPAASAAPVKKAATIEEIKAKLAQNKKK